MAEQLPDPAMAAYLAARAATDSEAADWKARIDADPEDMVARGSWLRWRFSTSGSISEALESADYREQLVWLVAHKPGSGLTRTVAATVPGSTEDELHVELRALWLEAVAREPKDPNVLVNAASFFGFAEPERCLELLETARDLSPTDSSIEQKLSYHWLLKARRHSLAASTSADRIEDRYNSDLGVRALIHAERAVALSNGTSWGHSRLVNRIECAVAANRWDLAERYAMELSKMLEDPPRRGGNGDAAYHSQRILGHVALRRGDADTAKACLLRCCSGGSSPVLASFGPDFSLAQELLDRRERETVLAFLEQCRTIWKQHGDEVDRLVLEVRSDQNVRLPRR